MAVELEGGCFVTGVRDGPPSWSNANLRIWQHVERRRGARAITLRTIEVAPGMSPALLASSEEVLYVLSGRGTIYVDGHACPVAENVGVHVDPERVLQVENEGPDPILIVSSQCPDPETSPRSIEPVGAPRGAPPRIARLDDRTIERTGDRWYRVMIDSEVTQFVGAIPPGRAPDHFHHYEEVLFILTGTGRMWAGETSTPIKAGACIFLPKRQLHCVENTGHEELRLLGVFYPAGSPAVRYS